MTILLKHGDTISFNYLDPHQGLQVATWRVYSAVSAAIAIGSDPVAMITDGRETISLQRVLTSGVAQVVPYRVVIEGKTYTVAVEGPLARLERVG